MKRYENPIMEIAFFEADDVITTSGEPKTNADEATAYAANLMSENEGAQTVTVIF